MEERTIIVAAALLLLVGAAASGQTVASSHQSAKPLALELRIEGGTPYEQACATDTFAATLAFYRELGMAVDATTPCTIRFTRVVTVAGQEMGSVLACFNRDTSTITMLGAASWALHELAPFGLEDPDVVYRMILAHEFAHYCNFLLSPGLHPVIDECIAGYIQFEVLSDRLPKGVPEAELGMAGLSRLSIIAYANDPQSFLLAAHSYFRDRRAMLRRCLSGNAPPIKDPFMFDR